MAARIATIVLTISFLVPLTACQREQSAGGTQPPAPLQQADGRIEWRGLSPCADCDGIETSLVLERSGDARRFILTETYLAPDGARFIDAGQWQSSPGRLDLEAEGGARRVYALLPDGRLQPRDPRGRRYSARQGDFLVPVTVGNAP